MSEDFIEEDVLDELAQRLEDPQIFDKKKTDRMAKFLDTFAWRASWPLGQYDFVRELLALNTPSKLTLLGFILAFPMTWFFYTDQILNGALCYIVGMICDFFDGSLARFQDDAYPLVKLTEDDEYALTFWRRVNLVGSTHFGTVFDAFKDKEIYYFALFSTGWIVVWHPLMYSSVLIALVLTVIRIRWIRNKLALGGKNSSKLPGKIKVCVEVGAISAIVLIPIFFPWFGVTDFGAIHYWSSNILVGISLVFGLTSLRVHIWLGLRKVGTKVKSVNAKRKAARSLR